MIYTLFPLHDALARWTNKKQGYVPLYAALPTSPLPSRWRPIFLLCGLRGALSIALVLSLPTTLGRRGFLEDVVYGVVLVTLLGQGIGLRILLPHWKKGEN